MHSVVFPNKVKQLTRRNAPYGVVHTPYAMNINNKMVFHL